jgi:anti-anti-sigma factor
MAADLWSTVDVDNDTGLATLRVYGDVDIATADTLHNALERVISRRIDRGSGPAIIDLGGVGFIGIAGIRVLVQAAGRLGVVGSRLVLLGSRPGVSRILEVWHHVGGPAPWDLGQASDRPSSRGATECVSTAPGAAAHSDGSVDRRIADSAR